MAYTKGITKEEFVAEIKMHTKLDNFIKGTYSEGQKGCAVGCSIMSISKLKGKNLRKGDHKVYEEYLGVPEWLALVEDTIFEGVSDTRSKKWPLEFTEAINVGSNLDNIKIPFIVYILEQNVKVQTALLKNTADTDTKKVIKATIKANQQMIEAQKSQSKISAAESAAWSAAESAWSAAESAWLAAESAVESAARSAAESAWSAAWSVESAAWSAARSAESAARSTARSAESAAYEKYADKLLELIKECK